MNNLQDLISRTQAIDEQNKGRQPGSSFRSTMINEDDWAAMPIGTKLTNCSGHAQRLFKGIKLTKTEYQGYWSYSDDNFEKETPIRDRFMGELSGLKIEC